MASRHINGKHSRLVLFIDGVKAPPLDVKNYDFGPVLDAIADGVNGESTERLDRELKHYAGKMTCFNVDVSKLVLLLKYDASMNDGSGGSTADIGFQILSLNPASKVKVAATEAVIDDWKWTSAGFTDRSMIDIPFRARQMTAI